MPVEIGCGGFAGQSMCITLGKIGINSEIRKKAAQNITSAVKKFSNCLCLNRENRIWEN
jgi:hypothetical protein